MSYRERPAGVAITPSFSPQDRPPRGRSRVALGPAFFRSRRRSQRFAFLRHGRRVHNVMDVRTEPSVDRGVARARPALNAEPVGTARPAVPLLTGCLIAFAWLCL